MDGLLGILGPSGSGKSTLLRTINHLERVDEGFIQIDGDYIVYQVLQHRQVRKQVKVLKHVADVDPLAEDLLLFHPRCCAPLITSSALMRGLFRLMATISAIAAKATSFARGLLVGDRRLYQVLQHRQVRKQVKVLKHVADVGWTAQ
jgi:ATPase subunit of ABC transporter with duplicated ATPase domains